MMRIAPDHDSVTGISRSGILDRCRALRRNHSGKDRGSIGACVGFAENDRRVEGVSCSADCRMVGAPLPRTSPQVAEGDSEYVTAGRDAVSGSFRGPSTGAWWKRKYCPAPAGSESVLQFLQRLVIVSDRSARDRARTTLFIRAPGDGVDRRSSCNQPLLAVNGHEGQRHGGGHRRCGGGCAARRRCASPVDGGTACSGVRRKLTMAARSSCWTAPNGAVWLPGSGTGRRSRTSTWTPIRPSAFDCRALGTRSARSEERSRC